MWTRAFLASLAILAFSFAFSGCASSPKQAGATAKPGAVKLDRWGDFARYDRRNPPQADPPAVRKAFSLLVTASPVRLQEAAQLLSPAAGGSWHARDLQGLGRALWTALYPQLTDNPFPADAVSLLYGPHLRSSSLPDPADTNVFRLVLPALSALGKSELSGFTAALKRADQLSVKTSVLPPYLLGQIAERSVPPQDALSFYLDSVRRDDSFYPGAMKAADLLVGLDRAAEALPLLVTLSATFPQDPKVFRQLAEAAISAGQPQQALDAAARAILLSPDDVDLIILRARAYEAADNWYQALWILDAVLKMQPDSVAGAVTEKAILMKARILADKAGGRRQALAVLRDAKARYASDPAFPELEGRILLDQGKSDDALRALNQALDLEPGRLTTLRLLLQEAVRLRRWIQGTIYLAQILEKSETAGDLELAYEVAWNLGDFSQAGVYARKLLKMGAGDSPHLLLARALHAAGQDEEARNLVDQGLPAARSPEARSQLLTLRAALTAEAQPESALDDLRAALLENPQNAEALQAISELLAGEKEYRKALAYLRHALELSPADAGLKLQVRSLEQQAETEE